MVAGAVYAIGTFLGAFNNYSERDASPVVRILGVYLPIILAAALVVVVLLFAFVFRSDAPDLPHAERDEDRAALQRAIGLAYATPVVGTAIAIIFGLVVYDTTKTELDVWIWVVIQLIIAASILIGTRFAAKARLARPLPPRERQTAAAAINLNLVLSIVFGAVVGMMAFTFGFMAIENLRDYTTSTYRVNPPTVSWVLEDLLPAFALLALVVVGIYRSILLRHGQTGRQAKRAAAAGEASEMNY
jgi:heme/copper-type cytochrome/quinol oxidase subunit 2